MLLTINRIQPPQRSSTTACLLLRMNLASFATFCLRPHSVSPSWSIDACKCVVPSIGYGMHHCSTNTRTVACGTYEFCTIHQAGFSYLQGAGRIAGSKLFPQCLHPLQRRLSTAAHMRACTKFWNPPGICNMQTYQMCKETKSEFIQLCGVRISKSPPKSVAS